MTLIVGIGTRDGALVDLYGAEDRLPCLGRQRQADMRASAVETRGRVERHPRGQPPTVGSLVAEAECAPVEFRGQGAAPVPRVRAAHLEDVAEIRPALDHEIELGHARAEVGDLDPVEQPVEQHALAPDMQLEIEEFGAMAVDEPQVGQIAAKARVVVARVMAQFDQAGAVDRERQAGKVAGIAIEQSVLGMCLAHGGVAGIDLAGGGKDGEEIAILQNMEVVPRVRPEPVGNDVLDRHGTPSVSLPARPQSVRAAGSAGSGRKASPRPAACIERPGAPVDLRRGMRCGRAVSRPVRSRR